MKFFVYIAILLVAIGGILLEIDWLTKPKLETKSPLQTVSMAVSPSATRAKAKTEGPNDDLGPVYPKKTDEPRSVGSVTSWPQSAETAGAGSTSVPAVPETVAQAEPKTEPSQKPAAETTGAATPAERAEPSTVGSASVGSNNTNAPSTAALATTPPAPVANIAAPNRCDVQACSSAYQSFRASDCTYQPFGGPRRVCERPPGTGQKVASQPREPQSASAARRSNKDAELREVVRRVKQITVPAEADDEDDSNSGRGERVIVIERPARRSW